MIDRAYVQLACAGFTGMRYKDLARTLKISVPTLYRIRRGEWKRGRKYAVAERNFSPHRCIHTADFDTVTESVRQMTERRKRRRNRAN